MMSYDEFLEIVRKKFDLGFSVEDCLRYCEQRENLNDSENVKNAAYIFVDLWSISRTPTGEKILRELDPNIKVKLIAKEIKDEERTGYHTLSHEVVVRKNFINPFTLAHELTHEVQLQQGGESCFLPTEQDRFVVDRMKEAEARLNATSAAYESIIAASPEEADIIKKWVVGSKKADMDKYTELLNSGIPEDEAKRRMLRSFYADVKWNEDYNEQALEKVSLGSSDFIFGSSVTYRKGIEEYWVRSSFPLEKVQEAYQKRLGLTKEDMAFFFNPQNIAAYPFDKVKEKTERVEELPDGTSKKYTYEGGELRQVTALAGEKIIWEERSIGGGFLPKKRCRRWHRGKGDVGALIEREDMKGGVIENVKMGGYDMLVFKNRTTDGITGIEYVSLLLNGKNIELNNAAVEEFKKEYASTKSVFKRLKEGKDVSDEDLIKAGVSLEKNALYLYGFEDDLRKVVNEEVRKRGLDKVVEDIASKNIEEALKEQNRAKIANVRNRTGWQNQSDETVDNNKIPPLPQMPDRGSAAEH